jgi:serine/threonine protein kinase
LDTPQYCRKCGTKLPPESQFCPTCGTSQDSNAHSLTSRPTRESSNLISGTTEPEAEPISTSQPTRKSTDLGTGRLPPRHLLHQRYRLLQTVGQGGMGAVYLAQDTQLGDRLVAVKEMSMSRLTQQQVPQAVEQFKREAHLLADLHHPNLPVIYDYFGEGDRWYLVMSFIQEEVVHIGIELCNVLEYLHTHQPQIIFRDLKPLNIMITPQRQIYLIDFGIARHFKQDQAKDTVYYYSVGYAPPEQYGQSQTGPRSDLYSLGATLYQMLSGHNPASKPFHFPSLQVLDPTIPAPLAKLIAQMVDLDELQRPASAALVKAELEKVLKPGFDEVSRKEEKKASDEKVEPQRYEAVLSSSIWQNIWNGFNGFFGKWRVIAWLCFMALSTLLGIRGGQIVSGWGGTFFVFDVVGIGTALVGLALLLSNGRAIGDILGGIAFTILGDLLLFYNTYTFYASGFVYNFVYNNTSPISPENFRLLLACASISTLLLFLLGVRFFVRSAVAIIAYIVGTSMMIVGSGLLIFSYTIAPNAWLVFGFFPTYEINPANLPNIMSLISMLQIILGIVVIILPFLIGRRKKLSTQSASS